jgi:putative nucleotidyltransferase with HDIG domain
MPNSIDALIQQVGDLPPLPQAAQKALSLIRNPKSDMSDLANVLIIDQGLTSTVLRWVNSSYYGLASPVSTVQQAVVYLGQNTIQSLVLAASISTYLYRSVPGYALDRGDLWKHSIGIATGAQMLTKKFGPELSEEAYHAGLLCDIGKLAFEVLLRKIDVTHINWQDRSFNDLEIEIFGIDHARMGAEMAKRWHLPESLQKAIEFHHQPSLAGDSIKLASAVHLADTAMMMLGIGLGKDGLRYKIDPIAFEVLGWTEDKIMELFDQMLEAINSAESFLGLVTPASAT